MRTVQKIHYGNKGIRIIFLEANLYSIGAAPAMLFSLKTLPDILT